MSELNKTQPPRVLFLHGFMGSALNWGSIRNFLEAKGNIKTNAIDLLGHALRHPKENFANAHKALVEDLEGQVKAFSPTHVVAHSFAFRPALLLGNAKPDLIPHLIVEDSSPEISKGAYDYLVDILNSPTPFENRDMARAFFDTKFGQQSAVSRFLLSNIRSTPEGTAVWRFDRAFLRKLLDESLDNPLWEEWKTYSGKTSFIYGSMSESMTADLIAKMKSLRPKLDVYSVDGAAHWVHADKAQDFVNVVESIVRPCDP